MKLSVIIPVYNGTNSISSLVEEVFREFDGRYDLEVVLVNDGSPQENAVEVCARLAAKDMRVIFLELSRNFGEHNAVMAGLNYCTGEAAVIIDDDFQNPPSEISALIEKLMEGYDVVYSRYEKKEHSMLRNLGSRFNNLMASILIRKPISLYLSSFKAINRFMIDELIRCRSPYPYIDGLILRVTRKYAVVPCRHHPRNEGSSGYTVRKLVSLWLNMFINFSILPLRMASFIGFAIALGGFIAAILLVIDKLMNSDIQAGWASLMSAMLVLSGVQLVTIGMIGEYLGRLFMKDSGQPQFVVRRVANAEKHNVPRD